jgi:hypothetical protein
VKLHPNAHLGIRNVCCDKTFRNVTLPVELTPLSTGNYGEPDADLVSNTNEVELSAS